MSHLCIPEGEAALPQLANLNADEKVALEALVKVPFSRLHLFFFRAGRPALSGLLMRFGFQARLTDLTWTIADEYRISLNMQPCSTTSPSRLVHLFGASSDVGMFLFAHNPRQPRSDCRGSHTRDA